MIVYKIEPTGQATNLCFKRSDYELQEGEKSIEGDKLPDIETLHEGGYKLVAAKNKLIEYIDTHHAKQKAQDGFSYSGTVFDIERLKKDLPLLDMKINNGALKVFPATVSRKRKSISAAEYPDFKHAFFQYLSIGTGEEGAQDFIEGTQTYHEKQVDAVLKAKSKMALNSIRTEVEAYYGKYQDQDTHAKQESIP
jgi:hypothetical protein